MTKITHSDMRRVDGPIQTQAVPQQNYIVEDMSNTPQTVDERLAAFEGNQIQVPVSPAPQKVSKEEQKKLESLIFMGRLSKEVDLVGHKFEMSTLTHKENNEIMSRLMKAGDAADIFTVRSLTLAFALKNIDGAPIETYPAEGSFVDIVDKRMAIIDSMQLALVERLYAAFEKLIKEADETVYAEAIKN